ncbi:uncharacterized protein [Spinacia oleracea]|uniref:Uncharacterized protein n=1 Tax=Spinacia oleracea TaxID=3562 RepID=A0ABM3R8B5_SPIOL|nr:uncharacterized protein LOC130467371 [Spinacia oleracea]
MDVGILKLVAEEEIGEDEGGDSQSINTLICSYEQLRFIFCKKLVAQDEIGEDEGKMKSEKMKAEIPMFRHFGSAMDRLSPEDKGVVEVPAWLSDVYTEDILKAVEEPTLPATKKRPASSTEAPKPKRPFFKKMGPAEAVTKPSVPKPSAPPAEGEVPPIQTPIPPPEQKEVPSQVDTETDGTAGAAADEAAVDQTAAADATTLSREDKGEGKETEAPSTDNASTPLQLHQLVSVSVL